LQTNKTIRHHKGKTIRHHKGDIAESDCKLFCLEINFASAMRLQSSILQAKVYRCNDEKAYKQDSEEVCRL